MRRDLPTGTVTFLFTDVEGSTRLLHSLGAEGYAEALAEHRRVIREACGSEHGVEVDTQGDAFFFAFPTAPAAIDAASAFTTALASGPISVRVGLHTGTPLLTDEGYIGEDLHRAARIAAAGHGGQVLVSASTAQLVELELRDLGEHRLKDLSAPERIYQLGGGDFPALKSLYRTNLPVPATPFLGRERELEDVVELLSQDGARLLTLTGPGGTGKTRLALQAAGRASDAYPDGVWWIPLAPLRDPALVLETAGQILGSQNGLAGHIRDKRLLCLFDNFEHLVDAAPDLAPLLATCRNLDLLVTSREPLHLSGEQEYSVPPLVHEEGVGFFLARARAAKPDFAPDDTVSAICARLDELPLALELAAARVKALSTAQILERLDERLPLLTGGARDAPERQRTLRATIEWSYDLLTAEEQRLFACLSVFRGGCTLEGAEDVCEASLDTLQSLLDKSLLRKRDTVHGARYWMLETIREYSVAKLDTSGTAKELRRRHAAHFVALAEEAEVVMGRDHHDADVWIARLEADHDNLRAALDELIASADAQLAQQLAGALWKFWYMTGSIGEGRRWLEAVLAFDTPRTALRARALDGATATTLESGDTATARRYVDESLAINEELADPFGIAHARFLLANVVAGESDYAGARILFEDCRERFQELGAEYYTLLSTRVLAWVCAELGDKATWKALHEENLPRARAAGNRRIEAMTLGSLAFCAIDEGRLRDAAPLARDSYRMKRDQGDRQGVASDLFTIARLLTKLDRTYDAARVLARSTTLYEEMGAAIPSYDVAERKAVIAQLRRNLGDDEYAKACEEGRSLSDVEVDGILEEIVGDEAA
jgi:predicted ATPase/class 3 adenylate cyclase